MHLTSFKTSQRANIVVELPLGLKRGTPLATSLEVKFRLGTGKAEGPVHCPPAPTLKPSKGRRPKNRHTQIEMWKWPWCLVSCLSWLAVRVSFPGSVPWFSFPVPVCFLSVFSSSFCFFLLAAGVTSQLPDGRHVGSKREGTDPRNGTGAPTQGPVFFQLLLYVQLSCVPRRACPCTSSSTLTLYFPRMLSLTTPIPSSVEQDKYFNPHRIFSIHRLL